MCSTESLSAGHLAPRPPPLDLAADNAKWLGLELKKHLPELADRATVEFVTRYKIGGRTHRLHEISRFVREEGNLKN